MLFSFYNENMLALEKELKAFAGETLGKYLGGQVSTLNQLQKDPLYTPDFQLQVRTAEDKFLFVCEAVPHGTLSVVRQKVTQLKYYLKEHALQNAFGLVCAETLSEQSMELCREVQVGCLDFAGNIYLHVGKAHVDIQGRSSKHAGSRVASPSFNSIFSNRASRVVHTLLLDPGREWRVQELSKQAQVSLGHVSNVTAALRERGWLEQARSGFTLSSPVELLDAWVSAYRRPRMRLLRYTTLQGQGFESAIRDLQIGTPKVLLAAESAARYVAPYLRSPQTTLYVQSDDLTDVEGALKLKIIPEGGNVRCLVVSDRTAFQEPQELAPGLWGTSNLRTYLDLQTQGGRSKEAAEVLWRERIQPRWERK